MPVECVFLGWSRPLCETVPEWLLAACPASPADLRDTAVVLPTRESGRRLRTALPLAAHERGLSLLSPSILVAPLLLAPPPGGAPVAGPAACLLAWREALGAAAPGEFTALLGPPPAGPRGAAWAFSVARSFEDLRAELADGALTVAEVAARGAELAEPDRWAALAAVEQRYLARLAARGLRDPVAARVEYARAGPPPPWRRIVLAAVPDPPRLLVALLDRLAGAGVAVTVLVAAPPAEAAAFDAWGRPVPDAWSERLIPLDAADLLLESAPEDQAARIAGLLGAALPPDLPAAGHAPALAIGAPDRETVGPLTRELAALGLTAFDPRNRPFADTPLCRLAELLFALQRRHGYAEFAALLRHPHALAALDASGVLLRDLDDFQSQRLPVGLDDIAPVPGDESRFPTSLAAALRTVRAWLRELREDNAAGLRRVLARVYTGRSLEPGVPADDAFREGAALLCDAARDAEAALASAPADNAPPFSDLLLACLRQLTLRPERRGERVDLEGWLELPWNPAPLLFVAGMNEGIVPDSRVGGAFLPDSLRGALGLRDDRARVARDAYVLTALLAQRAAGGRVVLLAGRVSASGDPLRPSRLLFRCADADLVPRARALFRAPPPTRRPAPFSRGFRLDPALLPPAAVARKRLDRMSPTSFRGYLACPLRFYLTEVLGMRPADDLAREPDAPAFGNLVHAALREMFEAPGAVWACGDTDRLARWLEDAVRREASRRYGDRRWLGVDLAADAAARRLRAFAAAQVSRHAEGWDIEAAEQPCRLSLAGVEISGVMDRVDRHRETGALCVLDYKTFDTAAGPAEKHVGPARDGEALPEAQIPPELCRGGKRGPARPARWVDLQLPIYVEMLRVEQPATPCVPAYVCLPASPGETGFYPWSDYSPALHEHAVACSAAIVRAVRAGVFWPPGDGWAGDPLEQVLLDDPALTVVPPPNPWPEAAP